MNFTVTGLDNNVSEGQQDAGLQHLLVNAERNIFFACMQEKNEALRSAATAASKGGSVNEARLHDRGHYISSLQVLL